jgi:hypothetical protein
VQLTVILSKETNFDEYLAEYYRNTVKQACEMKKKTQLGRLGKQSFLNTCAK